MTNCYVLHFSFTESEKYMQAFIKKIRQHTVLASQGRKKKAVILEIISTGQNHDCVSCSAKVCYHTVHLLKISWKEYFIQSYTREVAMR